MREDDLEPAGQGGDHPDDGEGNGKGKDKGKGEDRAGGASTSPGRLELIIAVALGLAAIGGAFAAYKNEQRNHDATVQFSHGIRNYDDAGQLYASGNATVSRDQSQFLAYATALHDNKPRLASYILHNVMDSRLQAAVAWWQSPANVKQPTPAPTPFTAKDPTYVIPQLLQATRSTDASKTNFEEARREQDKADHFALVEVILATALFLYGIAGVSRNMTLKLSTLATGAVIFVISLILLLTG